MSDLIGRLRDLAASLTDVASEFRALHGRLKAARDRRKWLIKAPRPRQCMQAALEKTLGEYQTHFDDQVRKLVTSLQDTPCDQPRALQAGGFDLLRQLTTGHSLTFLLSAALRTELRRAVGEMEWAPDPGPAAGPRASEIAKLDREIATLEAAISEARDRADQAGISLQV